jgi:DNA-binding PadR family transcriptional regulator
MARTNHSRPVILGCLADGPRSGYDIRRFIAGSLGNFWNESFGQIYPALRSLEAEGLVRRAEPDPDGRPQRQLYAITDAGRAHLAEWLQEPAAPQTFRVEALVKLFFAPQVGPAAARAQVARFRAEQRTRLARYRAIADRLERDYRDDPRLPYWQLTVAFGLESGRAMEAWCTTAEAVLAGLEKEANHG